MKRLLPIVGVLLFLVATQVYSQQQSTVPSYLEFDDHTLILREHLRQDQIGAVPSFRMEPNEWFADVYLGIPSDYFPLAPNGAVMQSPSDTFPGREIFMGPNALYLVVIYDFEHDLIIEAGEWKDLNGNFLVEDNEWFDENGNGIREFGEWTDEGPDGLPGTGDAGEANGIVDLGELLDLNGNQVFDIGEWHEGRDTDLDGTNNLAAEFNGAVDPDEWIGMNRDRSITKKLALKIYKKIFTRESTNYYKEIDYQEYINPSLPNRIIQHPALRYEPFIANNHKLVLLLRLDDCERCEIVGDTAWYEDEFARIVFNFQGFFRETLHTTLPRCEGCYEATVSHYVNLQIYMHEKYDLLFESFYLHSMERRGLPDNRDGTTAYYYTPQDEMSRIDDYKRRFRSLVSFDPYYLVVKNDNELVLYETIYGKALMVPYEDKEEKYSSHTYKRKYPDGTEKDIRIEVAHVYQIETIDCEQVLVARLLIDEDASEQSYNTSSIDPDEKIYTVFYYACDDHFENNVIFPEEYEEGISDFAIVVEKIELENEKVWLKFIREVDSEVIPTPLAFPYGFRDYQVVFDELDRDRPLGACDYYPKEERHVPRFEKILVDVCLPIRDLLNNVVLKYEDLKGNPAEITDYEEQPWEMSEFNTEISLVQVKKIAYNPNAADWSGAGYPDIDAIYVPPLDPAPGLVPTDTDFDGVDDTLLPNFQVTDEDFSGTCVPGDTITFYIEVYNASGAPIFVRVEDDIPAGMINAGNLNPPIPPPVGSGFINDTNGDGITGNGGDTVGWSQMIPPGYTLFSYQALVDTNGSIAFGSSIINSGVSVYYYEGGLLRISTPPSITIEVQAAQLIKEPFQDLACTIPAPTILPGSRLYYRLTVYQTEDPLSINPRSPFTAYIVEISDVIPTPTSGPQYHVSPAGLAPQPIVANTILWQGNSPLNPGGSIFGIYSVFVPVGSAGRIVNTAQFTYEVVFPVGNLNSVSSTSNIAETWIVTTPSQITEPLEPCLYMRVEKDGPPSQAAGVITYRILVTNLGQGPYADAYNIVIIDKLPSYVSPPFNITASNPFVTWNTFDSDGDGVIDTIVWKLNQLQAGADVELGFETTVEIENIPYNCYMLKVFTQDLYRPEQDRYLGMGGIARADQYKVTPEDLTETIKDAVFTQVMKGAEKVENYLIKAFESRFYDNFYFDFVDFNEKDRSVRFRLFTGVKPNIDINVYWGILEQNTMDTGSPQIYSEDTFLAHVLVRNDGDGSISEISYQLDAPDFVPVDMTWVYNLEQHLELEVGPEEQAGLLFLMKAPSVSKETTFPVKVKITYSDGSEIRTETKTVYLNVLSQRRANLSLKKNILEGKSVVKETGKEVADMRVGEERTIVAYIKNLSEEKIKQVHFIDQIPAGLEVIEGHAEWMGSLEPGEVVRVTYKIKVKQIGVYQFRGKTFYKDERDHVYEGVSNVTEIRVITDPGPKLTREIDSDVVTKGDTMTVVIRVENDTPNFLEHIQIVDIMPEGFVMESLETKGLKEEDGTIRYYIDELEPNKYILLKYTLKAGEAAGKFTYKGVRLAYENRDGLKEEILSENQELLIPETETPNVGIDYQLIRKVDSDGEYITVGLTLPNMGGIAAKNIRIHSPILDGTEFVGASADYLQEGGNIIFMVDEIGAGDEYVLKYTFKVPHFNQDRTYVLHANVLYSDDFDREYSAGLEEEFDVKSQKPSVKVTKVLEKNSIKLNFSVRVAVNVINEGEIPATTQVADPLPEGMVLLSGSNVWEGRLEPGESAQIMYEMLCTRVGTFSLPQASATYYDRWKIAYIAESEPTPLNIRGILVEKTSDVRSLKVGEVVVVTVSVTNTYDEKATNIIIDDPVPEELTLVEGNSGGKIEALSPGETITFTYSLKPEKPGTFNLGAATATFIDVYNDKHESESESISLSVEALGPPPTQTPPPTPSETPGEGVVDKLAEGFDLTFILVIFLIMAITMMLAFLLIERRRTEEEVLEEELPPMPEQREIVWKKEEVEKPALPSAEERAEAQEELAPLDVHSRRQKRTEEQKEEIGRVAEAGDVRDIMGLEEAEEREEMFDFREKAEKEEKFRFEREREPEEDTGFGDMGFEREEASRKMIEDVDLEDLFAEEKTEELNPPTSDFSDVRDIVRMTREEESSEEDSPGFQWEQETGMEESGESDDLPGIRELIKGTKKTKESESLSDTNSSEPDDEEEDFDPRGIIKGKD